MLPTNLEEMTLDDFGVIDGYEVLSSDGHWVGSIDLVFSDDVTGRPEWLGVWSGEPLAHRRIVPIRGATREGTKIHLPHARDVVERAPSYHEHDGHVRITKEQEAEAHSLYGLEPLS
jgi:hypothetical protein